MWFSDCLRTVLIIPFKYDSLSIWVIFSVPKSIFESIQHPVHAFVNHKYLPTVYMINWQPAAVCKCFSQGIFGDHYSGHYLNVRESPEVQVMMLVQNCLKLYRLYDDLCQEVNDEEKSISFPDSILIYLCCYEYAPICKMTQFCRCLNWHSLPNTNHVLSPRAEVTSSLADRNLT